VLGGLRKKLNVVLMRVEDDGGKKAVYKSKWNDGERILDRLMKKKHRPA